MKKKTIITKLQSNLSEMERTYLAFLLKKLETFNNVYLLTQRFIDKVEEYTDEYFKLNNLNTIDKYHLYVSIGFTMQILVEESEISTVNYFDVYKVAVNSLGLNKDFVYDEKVEKLIKSNLFYKTVFIIKTIKRN